MMNIKEDMLHEMNEAGYVEDGSNITDAVDHEDRFIFIHYDEESEEYTVGEFFKANSTKAADFSGVPLGTTGDYSAAKETMVSWALMAI